MTLAQKLRQLRQLEGDLRGLGRELTQAELVRAIKTELGETISQSYLSLIEKGSRQAPVERIAAAPRAVLQGASRLSRQRPARISDRAHVGGRDDRDRGSIAGSLTARRASPTTRRSAAALERLAAHAETRRCLVLLGEMISMPGLVDRLSETLVPEER